MPAIIIPLAIAAVGAVAKGVQANQARQREKGMMATANRESLAEANEGNAWRAGLSDPNSQQGQIAAMLGGPQTTTSRGSYSQDQSTQGTSGATLGAESAGLPALVKERAATAGPVTGRVEQSYRNAALQGQADDASIMNMAAERGVNPDVLRAAGGGGQAAVMRAEGRQGAEAEGQARRTAANAGVADLAQMLLQTDFSNNSQTRGTRGNTRVDPGNAGALLGLTRPQDQQIFVGGQRA
jgi:hypothetical protein